MSTYYQQLSERFFDECEQLHIEAQEAQEHEELVLKSLWISDLLQDFNIEIFKKWGNKFIYSISLRGFHHVDFNNLKWMQSVTTSSDLNTLYFTSVLHKEDVVEHLSIAVFLALEDVGQPIHVSLSDNCQEPPF